MSFAIFFVTIIIFGIIYYIYVNFVSILLQKLDSKIENFCLHTKLTMLDKNIKLIIIYNYTKIILFLFSLFFFFSCSWVLILYLYELDFNQFIRAFFVALFPYLCILYFLFQICLNIFTKKKVNLH